MKILVFVGEKIGTAEKYQNEPVNAKLVAGTIPTNLIRKSRNIKMNLMFWCVDLRRLAATKARRFQINKSLSLNLKDHWECIHLQNLKHST